MSNIEHEKRPEIKPLNKEQFNSLFEEVKNIFKAEDLKSLQVGVAELFGENDEQKTCSIRELEDFDNENFGLRRFKISFGNYESPGIIFGSKIHMELRTSGKDSLDNKFKTLVEEKANIYNGTIIKYGHNKRFSIE